MYSHRTSSRPVYLLYLRTEFKVETFPSFHISRNLELTELERKYSKELWVTTRPTDQEGRRYKVKESPRVSVNHPLEKIN